MTELPEWQVAYRKALAETDSDQFMLKLSRALREIAARLTMVEFSSLSAEEKEALGTALVTLRRLQELRDSSKGAA
jgi:hypothetical protein